MTKQISKIDPPMFAFWEYSTFNDIRGYLGAEFTEIRDGGAIYAPNYQKWFKPAFITTVDNGVRILSEIEDLQNRYTHDYKELHKKYIKERDEIIKKYKP